MRIGLIGCGIVGRRLGIRLLRSGHELWVHDRVRATAAPLLREGARWKESPREVGRGRDGLVTALPGPDEVEEVLLRDDGLWAGTREGTIHVETSTVGPDCARRLAKRAAERGLRFLDAPLSRGPIGGSGPGITVWIGGDAATFDEARPMLDAMADHLTWCGGVGHAQVTKLINNLITQSMTVVLGEALALGLREGVPLEILRTALRHGTAQSRLLDEMLPFGAFQGDWRPGLRLDLAIKDLRLARELARRHGVELPVSERSLEAYLEAGERGWGGLNAHAVVRLAEERSGVELRSTLPDAESERDPLA